MTFERVTYAELPDYIVAAMDEDFRFACILRGVHNVAVRWPDGTIGLVDGAVIESLESSDFADGLRRLQYEFWRDVRETAKGGSQAAATARVRRILNVGEQAAAVGGDNTRA